jgi:hypothetical protein
MKQEAVGGRLDVMRSGFLTVLALACVLGALFFGYREHRKGNFHKLITPTLPAESHVRLRPGGQDVVVLRRMEVLNGASPEFLSATMMPGLGMQIQQITLTLPFKGEIPLLDGPDLETLTKQTAIQPEEPGAANVRNTGAGLSGGPFIAYIPTQHHQPASAANALTLQASDSSENQGMPDGGNLTALFRAPDKNAPGKLPEGIELRVSAAMSGRAMDLTMTARNTRMRPVDLRLSWFPRLRIPSGDRAQARLLIPSSETEGGNGADFSAPKGRALENSSVNATYIRLRRSFLSSGPEMELQDPASAYSLRITALSMNIHSLRVIAPADKNWVILAPLGEPDDRGDDTSRDTPTSGRVNMLDPGETLQWRIRLELVPLQMKASE